MTFRKTDKRETRVKRVKLKKPIRVLPTERLYCVLAPKLLPAIGIKRSFFSVHLISLVIIPPSPEENPKK